VPDRHQKPWQSASFDVSPEFAAGWTESMASTKYLQRCAGFGDQKLSKK
jgi:hypothetical protein